LAPAVLTVNSTDDNTTDTSTITRLPLVTRKATTMNTFLVNVASLRLALTDANKASDPNEGFTDGDDI
jgi:hypothetical protein